jgi:hypothetical protein
VIEYNVVLEVSMTEERIPITSPEDFHAAMGAVQSSLQLLGMFDWQTLVDQTNFFEGAGVMLDPTKYQAMLSDPQWEQKKRIFRAAAHFVKELDEVAKELGL